MRIPFSFALATSAMALLVAGCGSSSSSSTTTSATSPAAGAPAAATTTSAGVVVASKDGKLGTILAAGSKRLTVYLFEADRGASSSCSGACAQVWPPVTSEGAAKAAGAADAAKLGSITRSDGTKQITYNGHPLYFYAKDQDDGDAYGAGIKSFGADWYALAPSGNKVENS